MTDKTGDGSVPRLVGRHRFPVYYEDTDFSGYVYHANYLKFFERSREDLVGLQYVRELYERNLHYVVAKMNLSFTAPAKHADIIEVETTMHLSPSPVSQVEQVAFRVNKNPDGSEALEELVSVKIKLVAVNGEGKPTRVPQDVQDYFLSLVN